MDYRFSERMANLSGSATREILKLVQKGGVISFAGGLPANDMLPMDELRNVVSDILGDNNMLKDMMQYGTTEGIISVRNAMIGYIREDFGITGVGLDELIVVSGGQQGIDLACRAFLDKGDAVLVENPTYLAALQIITSYQAKAYGVKASADGLDIKDLEEKIRLHNPKLLYIVPTFSNPTGNTYSLENRKAIAELTAKYSVMVVEDDPYAKLRFAGEPLPPIKTFDKTGNVIYITSFSKIISPGIRAALAAGHKDVIRKMAVCKQGQDLHTSSLSQVIVGELLTRGVVKTHVEKVRPIYKRKQKLMIDCLEKYMPDCYEHTDPEGGLFIWGEFKGSSIDTKAVLYEAIEKSGVAYVQGTEFFADGGGRNAIRFNFSNPTEENIEKGCKALGAYFKTKV